MTTYTIRPQQSLFDVAVEVYGDVQGVFWLLDDNQDLNGVTDRIQAGQVLDIRAESLNVRQATYLADFAPFQTIEESDKPSGVGYWLIDEYVIQ